MNDQRVYRAGSGLQIEMHRISPVRKMAIGGLAFLTLLSLGTVGYVLVEGWSIADAFYMTVITVSTVGFEVEPLSGAGRVFTSFVVLFGVGTAFYILTTMVQVVVEGEVAELVGVRRMTARIEALRDHYILCGFGRVGEEIVRELVEHGVSFVIVENNPEALGRAQRQGYPLIDGDATEDDALKRAGIHRARTLLAASDSDADNTYITLTAKALQPDLFVVARVAHSASEARVRRAGADRVISPYSLAGRRMALSALQPLMVDFIDGLAAGRQGEQMLAELDISDQALIVEQTVETAMVECGATTLLAIQRPDGEVLLRPPAEYVLKPGDRLMLLSSESDMDRLGRTRDHA